MSQHVSQCGRYLVVAITQASLEQINFANTDFSSAFDQVIKDILDSLLR